MLFRSPPAHLLSAVMMAETGPPKVNNFTFTNNLATATSYGFFGSGVGQGTATLNAYFTNWVFSKNVLLNAPAGAYPPGSFFPSDPGQVRFVNYTGANYALAADSPYKSAGTDGKDIGADLSVAPAPSALAPNPPNNVIVK